VTNLPAGFTNKSPWNRIPKYYDVFYIFAPDAPLYDYATAERISITNLNWASSVFCLCHNDLICIACCLYHVCLVNEVSHYFRCTPSNQILTPFGASRPFAQTLVILLPKFDLRSHAILQQKEDVVIMEPVDVTARLAISTCVKWPSSVTVARCHAVRSSVHAPWLLRDVNYMILNGPSHCADQLPVMSQLVVKATMPACLWTWLTTDWPVKWPLSQLGYWIGRFNQSYTVYEWLIDVTVTPWRLTSRRCHVSSRQRSTTTRHSWRHP